MFRVDETPSDKKALLSEEETFHMVDDEKTEEQGEKEKEAEQTEEEEPFDQTEKEADGQVPGAPGYCSSVKEWSIWELLRSAQIILTQT